MSGRVSVKDDDQARRPYKFVIQSFTARHKLWIFFINIERDYFEGDLIRNIIDHLSYIN